MIKILSFGLQHTIVFFRVHMRFILWVAQTAYRLLIRVHALHSARHALALLRARRVYCADIDLGQFTDRLFGLVGGPIRFIEFNGDHACLLQVLFYFNICGSATWLYGD